MQLLVRRMPAKRCTLSFSSPRLARTRLISGARPRTAPVFPDRGKAPARPPRTETPEKLSFAPWLFGRFPCQPAICGLKGRVSRPAARKRGEISERVQASPFAQKRSKKLSSAPWLFRAFPLPAGGLRPEGPLSRPAARKRKGRLAAGRRNGVRRGRYRAPRESLSTFFSEESRGPSRPERQAKRSLRGKSQTEKGER